MKKIILFYLFAAALLCQSVLAQDASNPTNQLHALVLKVRTDIQSGKRTEAELSDDIKQFDALLAEHKGEKTDAMAAVLYMKAQLYSEVIGDTAKADALIKQLKNDYSGTQFVDRLEEQDAREAESKKIQDSLAEGAQFPDFNEKDVMGQPLSIANYKGKVVMIDFWATWCGPCRGEIPNVVATYQKYHDKGFEIIGVSLDSDQQRMLSYTKENNMTWQQYFDGQGWNNKLAVKYGIESIPMTFLLDGNGKIIGKDLRGQELTDMVANAVASK
jgi:thiol-disulfide isomerase/thioredoxin